MSWHNIKLSEISTQPEVIPAGKYVFELVPGAKLNEKGSLLASASITSDGDFKGRRVFFSYPDPESVSMSGKINSWSAVAFKRLVEAIGVDLTDGETPVDYLNRAAGNHFSAPVTVSPGSDEYPAPRVNMQLFQVSPAV
jgi:hypothetical protein